MNPPRGDSAFKLLDLAGGTGDVPFASPTRAGRARVTVADINAEMLAVGRERAAKSKRTIEFIEANAEKLPPDQSFDAVTIAFGIRNVPRIDVALKEAHRVLKIGGRFLCLEFSSVDVPASTGSTISTRSMSFRRSAAR